MDRNQKITKQIETLRFLVELGVTEVHEDNPINRYTFSLPEEEKVTLSDRLREEELIGEQKLENSEPEAKVLGLVENATSLSELKSIMEGASDFSAPKLSKKMNFSFGRHDAKVMVLCEPPGRREILESRIYSGEKGIMFDKMYNAIGLSVKEESLYVVPVFPWRLSPNSEKMERDIKLFYPFLQKHISIVKPPILVVMTDILDKYVKFGTKNSNDEAFPGKDIKSFKIPKLGRLIDFPNEKKSAWEILKEIKILLGDLYE